LENFSSDSEEKRRKYRGGLKTTHLQKPGEPCRRIMRYVPVVLPGFERGVAEARGKKKQPWKLVEDTGCVLES